MCEIIINEKINKTIYFSPIVNDAINYTNYNYEELLKLAERIGLRSIISHIDKASYSKDINDLNDNSTLIAF